MHIKLTSKMHQELKSHLHPGDGLEALAFAVCGRLNFGKDNWLFVHELFLMPYDKCDRKVDSIRWKTEYVEDILEKARTKGFGIIKLHSHPRFATDFSDLDDISDTTFFESVYGWTDTPLPHASVIMFPDGSLKGRLIAEDLSFQPIKKISIIGENIEVFEKHTKCIQLSRAFKRNEQTFGKKTTDLLSNLKVAVIGCSGTGSPVIEQLVRLGVGELVLIDSDIVEEKNLNRIIGTTLQDAKNGRYKVDVLKEYIENIGLNTKVTVCPVLLQESREAMDELASCDVIFGCLDSIEGRYVLNLMSTYYLIPLVDIGVKLVADGEGGIDSINGNIHYVYPGSQTLIERKVFTIDQLSAESLERISPEEHQNRQVYFDNIEVDSPAVISVNMIYASLGVNEMLNRLHPFRYGNNSKYSHTCFNLTDWDINISSTELSTSMLDNKYIGVGNLEPDLKNISI
ncbi:ThiF family protein [Aquimarina sp. MAR_2010_214]|nr:ThiF family protein [Aquimarina sp. MAR_2010_214]